MGKKEIQLIFSNILINIIENNKPYKWIYTKESFVNKYNGSESFDNSGEVIEMSEKNIMTTIKLINSSFLLDSEVPKLREILNDIKINRWTPTYKSNCGKYWISYLDLFKEKYKKFNNSTSILKKIRREEVEFFYKDFMENRSYQFYLAKMLKELRKENSSHKKYCSKFKM